MSIAEDYLPPLFEGYDEDVEGDGITCKFCGLDGLEWEEGRTKPGNRKVWQLVDERGDIHDCRSDEVTGDEFPAVN